LKVCDEITDEAELRKEKKTRREKDDYFITSKQANLSALLFA